MLKPEVELLRERVAQLTAELDAARESRLRTHGRLVEAELREREAHNREVELFRIFADMREMRRGRGDEDE